MTGVTRSRADRSGTRYEINTFNAVVLGGGIPAMVGLMVGVATSHFGLGLMATGGVVLAIWGFQTGSRWMPAIFVCVLGAAVFAAGAIFAFYVPLPDVEVMVVQDGAGVDRQAAEPIDYQQPLHQTWKECIDVAVEKAMEVPGRIDVTWLDNGVDACNRAYPWSAAPWSGAEP